MRIHKEAFDALVQFRAENITDIYLTISSELADILLSFCENPSPQILKDTIKSDEFHSLKSQNLATTGTHSQMTIEYLKDVSLMLMLVTAARKANIEMHLQAEREFLKIVFAFDHINYARYNSFQHMLLFLEQRLNSRAYQDLLSNGHTASTTGNNFSGVSDDLLTEWFNKETKESDGPFRGGYSTQMSTINT